MIPVPTYLYSRYIPTTMKLSLMQLGKSKIHRNRMVVGAFPQQLTIS